MRTSVALLVAAAAVAVALPTAALAQPGAAATAEPRHGVAVDLGAVRVDEGLPGGSRHALPAMRVRNPGTVTTSYRMVGRPGGTGTETPGAWLSFDPVTFTLDPGGQQVVAIELTIPRGADAGTYTALLAAQVDLGAGAGDAASTRVGAAAASRLEFDVVPVPAADGWWQRLWDWLTSLNAWVWVTIAVVVLVVARWWFSQHYRVRLERV